MHSSFQSLGLNAALLRTIKRLGFTSPSYIQRTCIPAILAGEDVIGIANTGSGKTAAFVLPIVHILNHDPYGIFALCLCPTRELAYQIAEQLTLFGSSLSLTCEVVVGGEDLLKQTTALLRRPNVVIATPGRLVEHFMHSNDVKKCFQKLKCLVLDEADRLLEETFESELRYLINSLPSRRQTLMFSATITPSVTAVQTLSNIKAAYFEESGKSKVVDGCQQLYCFMPEKIKDVYLVYLVRSLLPKSTSRGIIFTSTIKKCEMVAQMLKILHIPALALHAVQKQRDRRSALSMFKSGVVNILVATDIASRGLDIPAVEVVLNYDVPKDPRQYIHRVGRTARFQTSGKAVTLVTQYDVKMVSDIEAVIGRRLENFETNEERITALIGDVFAARKLAKIQMNGAGGFEEALKAKESKNRLSNKTRGL